MTELLTSTPQLTKGNDGSLSCSFTARYTTLPVSIPRPHGEQYSMRVHLQCENGTWGKIVGEELRLTQIQIHHQMKH